MLELRRSRAGSVVEAQLAAVGVSLLLVPNRAREHQTPASQGATNGNMYLEYLARVLRAARSCGASRTHIVRSCKAPGMSPAWYLSRPRKE